MKYMLDTDICSYILKRRPVLVLRRFESIQQEQLCISVITLAELLYGVERSSSTKINRPIVKDFVSRLRILPWDVPAAEQYGKLRTVLEQQGTPIGNMDMMIASHALSQNMTVVTNNLQHFQRVPQLSIENWLTQQE